VPRDAPDHRNHFANANLNVARVLSTLALLPVLVGVIWALPAWGTLVLASVVMVLAVREYVPLVERPDEPLPRVLIVLATLAAGVSLGWGGGAQVEGPLLAALVVFAGAAVGAGRPDHDVARRVAVSVFPLIYIGLPVGALLAVRERWGPEALLALLFTVMVSDIAQFYGGRALGRRLLAPVVSPKKTVEGAASGFVAGVLALPLFGHWWLPGQPPWTLALLGATLVLLGIAGDLFESLLKRGAGVKDASGLIPGHGGMLDRLDSLLLAGPVYYLFLRYGAS
jgi:phosphatidate cytidylyltransferase